MLTLLSRSRGHPAARRPHFTRLAVERLEGRDAPSDLVGSSLPTPPPSTPAAATAPAVPPPRIDDVQTFMAEDICQYTLIIKVTDPANNLAGVTVTVTGDGLEPGGQQVQFNARTQDFRITFELPTCTDANAKTHWYRIVADGGNGRVSRMSMSFDQTPRLPPTR